MFEYTRIIYFSRSEEELFQHIYCRKNEDKEVLYF